MKRIHLIVLFSFLIVGASIAQNNVLAVAGSDLEAAFSWESGLSYNFGKIAQNQPASHEFAFTNTGSAPLIISNAKGTCGCTVTEYSKDPIAPGAQGMVAATYNAKKLGTFTKTITVYANTGDPVTLSVKGEVVEQLQ